MSRFTLPLGNLIVENYHREQSFPEQTDILLEKVILGIYRFSELPCDVRCKEWVHLRNACQCSSFGNLCYSLHRLFSGLNNTLLFPNSSWLRFHILSICKFIVTKHKNVNNYCSAWTACFPDHVLLQSRSKFPKCSDKSMILFSCNLTIIYDSIYLNFRKLHLTLHHITKPNQLTILFNKIAETLGIFGVAKKKMCFTYWSKKIRETPKMKGNCDRIMKE